MVHAVVGDASINAITVLNNAIHVFVRPFDHLLEAIQRKISTIHFGGSEGA